MDNITDNYYKQPFVISEWVEIFLMITIILFCCFFSTFAMSIIDSKCNNKFGNRNSNRKGLCYYIKTRKVKKYKNTDKVQPEDIITI